MENNCPPAVVFLSFFYVLQSIKYNRFYNKNKVPILCQSIYFMNMCIRVDEERKRKREVKRGLFLENRQKQATFHYLYRKPPHCQGAGSIFSKER